MSDRRALAVAPIGGKPPLDWGANVDSKGVPNEMPLFLGDSNLDGTVDAIDLNALAQNWRCKNQ